MTTIVRGASDLGDAIRTARIAQGLSQAELAQDAQVGRQWLVGLEAGDKSSARLDMVLRLLRELRLPVLLDAAPEPDRSPATILTLVRADDIIARHTEPNPK
ncbi:MAG: helix-turn-helix domain-containing protein [Propionibacteriaceae bacterium]|jgi:transcriptional regulator with XRE-family HTH domain|nr:helix-turn-helix domain-containing protein [Propionibacteriaceae bacterium]